MLSGWLFGNSLKSKQMEKVIVSRETATSEKIQLLKDNWTNPQFAALKTAINKKLFKLEWLDADSADAWLVTCNCYVEREFTEADICLEQVGTDLKKAGSKFKAPQAREWAGNNGIKQDSFHRLDVSLSILLPTSYDSKDASQYVDRILADAGMKRMR